MKCGALVRYQQQKTKDGTLKFKKNGEPRMTRTHVVSRYSQIMHPHVLEDHPKSEFTRCDGSLKVNVEEGSGCCCGYMSTDFEVEYECQECGNKHFPELPSSRDELEEFLQQMAEDISEAKRKRRLDERVRIDSMSFEERLEWLKSKK
jgi:hypothetical protein